MASSATWGHSEALALAATEGHVWVCGYVAAGGVGDDVMWLILPLESTGMSLLGVAAGDHMMSRDCAELIPPLYVCLTLESRP